MDSEKKELMIKTYRQFMEIGLGMGDTSLLQQIADEKIVGFGTAIDEKPRGINEVIQLIENQKAQSKSFDISWRIVPIATYNIGHDDTTVFADDLYLTIKAGDETFEMYVRISTVLHYVDGQWKVIHWHASKPEPVESQKDSWGLEIWKQKAEELEKLVEEKTADLLHKNRELQIESALEKVRTMAMGMKAPEDMLSICQTISRQLEGLGLEHIRNVQTAIFHPDRGTYMNYEYYARHDKTILTEVDYQNHPIQQAFATKMMKGPGEEVREHLSGQKMLDWHAFQKTTNQFVDDFILVAESLNYYWFSLGPVALGISTYAPLSPKEIDLFKRFIKVFELAYQRYLDIEKALIQAREAQIESALERVRSRTMAMQKSEELPEAAILLFQQIQSLGMPAWSAGYCTFIEDRSAVELWMSSEGNLQPPFTAPTTEDPLFIEMRKGAEAGKEIHVVDMGGEALAKHYQYMRTLPVVGKILDSIIESGHPLPTFQVMHQAYFSRGFLLFITYEPIPEAHEIFKRFAKVFDQTYTRFLDLQKAEAQAREAQIEAALERVRSKTMAMHNSQEVGESVATLFDELMSLGVLHPNERCGIGIMHTDHRMEAWTAAKTADGKAELTIGYLDMTLHPLLVSAYQGWVEKKEVNQYRLEGDDKIRYHDAMLSQPNYKIKRDYYSGAIRIIHYDFYFKEGCLYVFSLHDLPPDSQNVYARFSTVFGQTYRRYQDLLKAEAQAREAQIEAALESIRSKAMAMRTSEDIAETTAASFAELKKLGVSSFRSGVGILTKGSRMAQVFADTRAEDGQTKALSTMRSMDEHPALQQQYSAWEKQEDYEQFLSGDELITYYSHPFFQKSNIDLQKNSEHSQECGYYFAFPDGLFYAWSYQPYTEIEKSILRRFRNIISLTFRRYLDLQKAEAQAREATKQASLDRVRAVIASMRSTEDLELITPLMFRELTTLGVPFIRCGVFIIHEDRQIIDAYLSSPSGTSLGVLHLPYQASELTMQTVESWRNGRVHRQHWNQADFIAWTKQMMEQHQIESSRTYQGADTAPESLDLHFVPFDQGMLYVGSLKALNDQELELVLALAKSFSIAYARYEDFVKLETAKANIESTLTELKSTQAQLIQSEKMASLGELTAGIAHEIQNPLNFVNNFSEINAELSEEILEAAAKGDIEEVKALATDIKSNQEKIREHGKRADSIVKGMLQHSRSSAGSKEPTDLAALADEYLRLSYHGMRAKEKSFNASIKTDFDPQLPLVPVVAQDIGRVLLNLFNNAFYAVNERKKIEGDGYEPEVVVKCGWAVGAPNTAIQISVQDNGTGIPESIKEKIFQPFFTTKPTGQGTGLGLSLSYDIVKVHGGTMTVNSIEGDGTTFILRLPYSES